MKRRWMGALGALGLAALLAGCDESRLETDHALLGPGDVSGPQLRPGLWRIEDDGCPVRETNPVADWPNCVRWMVVKPGELATMEKAADGLVWTRTPYLLAGPGPQAMQVAEDGGFGLYGLRVLSSGEDGQAVRLRRWAISCGPVRTTGEKDEDGRPRTAVAAWPGVVMRGDHRCRPDGVAGLMSAAAASETGEKSPDIVMHWVREGPL